MAAPSNPDPGQSHGQKHEQTSSQPVGASAESTPREITDPQASDQAAPSALKPDHQELARLGWAPVKRAGPGMVRDLQREIADNDDGLGTSNQGKGTAGTTDLGAHADKEQSFETEPAPFGRRKVGRDALTGEAAAATMTASASSQAPDKVETVLHKVERGENFWTIARLYYPSGRYYRALWKYNSAKVPVIDKLYVNTVLTIPPPEDLDPAYIDPPGTRAPRLGAKDPNLAARDDRSTDRRVGRTEGVPVRRSSRSDPELNLPVSDPFTEQASDRGFSSRGGGRSGGPSRAVNDDDSPDQDNASDNEPEVRSRSTVSRPVYKVRRYDTLRTIARDTLGDSRRADEVLELNRDIIDDPGHLIVGQILELPEDAKVVRARSRE
jgi:nucleoid-associated protein YgaU